jgi:hypothetical protein
VHEKILNSFKKVIQKRYTSVNFLDLQEYLNLRRNQKSIKTKQKIIKLEDMIDECFSSEIFQFKLLMQTEKEFSNLFDDFFRYKYFLVYFNFRNL